MIFVMFVLPVYFDGLAGVVGNGVVGDDYVDVGESKLANNNLVIMELLVIMMKVKEADYHLHCMDWLTLGIL